jgi:hypothetical protein
MNTKYSFWQLLDEFEIEIPQMQRDYAQGRLDERTSQVRKNFLDTLYTAVDVTSKSIDLDFIYGSSHENPNGHGKTLHLLDGQQRITTLFLLHCYVARATGNLDKDVIQKLKQFSYATRISSRDFCSALVEEDFEIPVYKDAPGSSEEPIELDQFIQDQSWFSFNWKYDPTIKSMLVVLAEIHRKFFHKLREDFWSKLTDIKKRAITFQFLDIKEYGLTGELYIRMNARGRPLTDFENFKAWLQGYVGDRTKFFDLDGQEINWKAKFDKEWSDLFWRNRQKGDEIIDDDLLRFFTGMGLFRIAENQPLQESELEHWVSEFHNNRYIPKSIYEKTKCFDDESISTIFKVLDFFLQVPVEDNREFHEHIFKLASKPNPTYPERVEFYAAIVLIKNGATGVSNLRHHPWIRFTGNLVKNTSVGVSEFATAIQSLQDLAGKVFKNGEKGKLVYQELRQLSVDDIQFFSRFQRDEEIRKASLILDDHAWEEVIIELEEHKYFNGQIGFLLDFSETNGTQCIEKFKKYGAIASTLFSPDPNGFLDHDEFLLQRALLVKGDYLVRIGSVNYSFCEASDNTLQQREVNWRKVFRDPNQHLNKKGFLKELFDELLEVDNLEKGLRDIILHPPADIDEWRTLLISSPEFIRYCEQRQIQYYGYDWIYLLSGLRKSANWKELRTYYLYNTIFKEGSGISSSLPFRGCKYKTGSGWEYRPYAYLYGFEVTGVYYSLCIHFREGDNGRIEFYFRFVDTEEENVQIPSNLEHYLSEKCGFSWNEDKKLVKQAKSFESIEQELELVLKTLRVFPGIST